MINMFKMQCLYVLQLNSLKNSDFKTVIRVGLGTEKQIYHLLVY